MKFKARIERARFLSFLSTNCCHFFNFLPRLYVRASTSLRRYPTGSFQTFVNFSSTTSQGLCQNGHSEHTGRSAVVRGAPNGLPLNAIPLM